jgi:hypothetical protein
VNACQPSELSGKTPSILLAEERQRLRPLKIEPRDLALRFPVVVGPRATVIHDNQSYTMPVESAGLVGALNLYPDRVTITAGRYEATHPRHIQRRSPSAVLGWRSVLAAGGANGSNGAHLALADL